MLLHYYRILWRNERNESKFCNVISLLKGGIEINSDYLKILTRYHFMRCYLTLLQGFSLWTQWEMHSIQEANKLTGNTHALILQMCLFITCKLVPVFALSVVQNNDSITEDMNHQFQLRESIDTGIKFFIVEF